MKRLLSGACAVFLLTAALSGCGGSASDQDAPPYTGPTYTMDDIRAANTVEAILQRHDSFQYTVGIFTQDNADAPDSSYRGQYYRENGLLQMDREFPAGAERGTYYEQGFADENYSGALYALSGDGEATLTLYPQDDYEPSLTALWTVGHVETVREEVTETSMQDDAVIVTTRTDYQDVSDLYAVSYYYLDPQTDDLLYWEDNAYSAADDSLIVSTRTSFIYDSLFTPEVRPADAILADTDYCETNLIVAPMQDEMEVHWYPVAHGTLVQFQSLGGYTLYSDEELTQTLDPLDIDISGEVRNIFAVPLD